MRTCDYLLWQRGNVARKEMQEQQAAAVKIQAAVRGKNSNWRSQQRTLWWLRGEGGWLGNGNDDAARISVRATVSDQVCKRV